MLSIPKDKEFYNMQWHISVEQFLCQRMLTTGEGRQALQATGECRQALVAIGEGRHALPATAESRQVPAILVSNVILVSNSDFT